MNLFLLTTSLLSYDAIDVRFDEILITHSLLCLNATYDLLSQFEVHLSFLPNLFSFIKNL